MNHCVVIRRFEDSRCSMLVSLEIVFEWIFSTEKVDAIGRYFSPWMDFEFLLKRVIADHRADCYPLIPLQIFNQRTVDYIKSVWGHGDQTTKTLRFWKNRLAKTNTSNNLERNVDQITMALRSASNLRHQRVRLQGANSPYQKFF